MTNFNLTSIGFFQGYRVVDIFNLDCLNNEHIQRITKVLKTFRPDFDIPLRSSDVNVKLLEKIYENKSENIQGSDTWWKTMDLHGKFHEQIEMETSGKVKIQSINRSDKINEKFVRKFSSFILSFSID